MNTPIKLSVSSILLAGILAGCSQHQVKPLYTDSYLHNKAKVSTGHVQRDDKEKKQVVAHAVSPKKKNITHNIGMPPAKLGQCYAKAKKPAIYKTVTKKVVVRKAMSKRVFVRGPQYRWVSKKVLVRPVSYTQRVIPAVYKTVNKRVMVKPSYLTWKKGKGLITRIDHATGEILCRVKIPAVYKNISRKVLVRAAKTIKTQRPAVYKTVKNKKLTSPAQYKMVQLPAKFINKKYRVKTASAKYVWRQVVCKTNVLKNRKATHYKNNVYKTTTATKTVTTTTTKKVVYNTQHKPRHKKTYTKKYDHNKRIITPKPRPYHVKSVQKKNIKKAAYSRKMAPSQRIRAGQYKRYKKIKTNDKKTASPRKKITDRNARANTYKPSRVKKVFTAATVVAKPKPVKKVTKTKKTTKKNIRLTKQNAILRIQTALTDKGFNPGSVDGKLGPATVAALTAFQKHNGLATGKLDRATLGALGLI